MTQPLSIVVLGLSLSSSWGNGHATTYRSLLKASAARGHHILFLERDVPWYAKARDLVDPEFCRLEFYRNLTELEAHRDAIARADAVVVGSYVPEGRAVAAYVLAQARGIKVFYDIDTPVTVAALERDACDYLPRDLVPLFDLYLSFTGGPILERLAREFGSPRPRALYCCVDPDSYKPRQYGPRWDLSYLGTFSPDRQPALEQLLIEPARRAPDLRFAVAGPQYPDTIEWPVNVERFEHVGPADHAEFYGVSRFTLNVTRADMVRAGWSPSVRLFEAAATGTPILSDLWEGLDAFFEPERDILVVDGAEKVLSVLRDQTDERRRRIGANARARVMAKHTAAHRARELETFLVRTRPTTEPSFGSAL